MDPQIYSYVGIRLESTFAKTPDEMFAHINVMYFADEKYMITEREVLTITNALSATGGYIEIIRLICVAVIYLFRAESFYASLMKKFLITENGPSEAIIQNQDETSKDDIGRNYNKIHSGKLSYLKKIKSRSPITFNFKDRLNCLLTSSKKDRGKLQY
ncbi:UNKNOWN [Stylonychia lemnae]|uniref:Uncharacterized protein n=1 Tax=Stylonychia lemnae TaxID=5949 RepID=A0A078ACU3_STYLE|nr:UNKNOWN [Stylonychia lemnae]|eukprot:CDW79686.1 UNKNOWN [Stylonychia lemnae]